MPAQTIQITNRHGLHARPAALFVQVASRYRAEVFVSKRSEGEDASFEANGKSIMGVMMLQAESGAFLTIRADGDDANDAVRALATLVESRFGEE
jgi:phosphocarrier protein